MWVGWNCQPTTTNNNNKKQTTLQTKSLKSKLFKEEKNLIKQNSFSSNKYNYINWLGEKKLYI